MENVVSVQEQPTGLEDVVRSVRALARSSRNVAESAVAVAERELAMAISISERLRDSVVTAQTLEEARKQPLPARLRQDAHRALDVMADATAVAQLALLRFVEGFVDERRPSLTDSGEKL
ncbi:MAG: hypothetical protein IT531_16210 [Burkholderiales bacterium]|nr:hypothetical protein [Burkholderiales bacterium]